MVNRQSSILEARRLAAWVTRELGRELRVARILGGMTQRDVAVRLHRSISHVSRVEHGLIGGVTVPQLYRHAAVVGLKPFVNLYPSVARPLDRRQLELIGRLRQRLHASWQIGLEVPMPIPGDLRAADAVLTNHECRVLVEAITRLADFQAQLRSANRKVRDLGADRLVLVVAATATNRRAIRDAGPAVSAALPVRTRDALRAFGTGRDPGGDALVLL